MSEEIQAAVQIIHIGFEGIEVAMKIGSGSLELAKMAVELIKGILNHEKMLGKTDMKKLLRKGGDLQVFQLKKDDYNKFSKLAKKYGVLYSKLPNVDKKSDMREVIFHTESVPRFNLIAQKLGAGQITGLDEFLKNADPEHLQKIFQQLQKDQKGPFQADSETKEVMNDLIHKIGMYATDKKSVDLESVKKDFEIEDEQAKQVMSQLQTMGVVGRADAKGTYTAMMDQPAFEAQMARYQTIADRIRAVSKSKDTSLKDISLGKTLIKEENDHAIKTRVPGTWGRNAKYIWIRKEDIMDIHDGKLMLTFLDMNKEYKLYSANNRVVGTMYGDELYAQHYDRNSEYMRKQYRDKVRKDEEAEKAEETTATKTESRETAESTEPIMPGPFMDGEEVEAEKAEGMKPEPAKTFKADSDLPEPKTGRGR